MPRIRFRCDVVKAGFAPRLLLGELERGSQVGSERLTWRLVSISITRLQEKAVVNVFRMMRFNMKLARLNDGLLLVLVKSDLA